MKKIICFLTAAAMVISLSIPAFAASSKVTVKNNVSSKPVTYTYNSEDEGETVVSVKTLMTKLSELTKTNIRTQTITITSESADSAPVNFKLRLSLPQKNSKSAQATPSPDEYSALDYYNIKVNSENGTLIYNYADEANDAREEGAVYKDIPLGTLNTSKANESATYNLTLSVNSDLNKTSIANTAKQLDWSIVSDTNNITEETPAPEATDTDGEISETASPDASPEVTASPAPAEKIASDKHGNYNLAKGEYIAGTDIDTGRYTMSGSGLVNVYTPEGKLKTTIALKEKNNSSANGVSEYVINLSEGEKLDTEAEIKLAPYVAPSASPTPSPTPKAASASGSSSSSSSSNASKSNPKTGDNTPIAGISAVGLTALVGAAVITLRKKNK